MSLATHERFTGYPAQLGATNPVLLNHIRSVTPNFGVDKMEIIPSGAVDRATIAENFRDQKIQIVSGDLATILTAISPVTGLFVNTTGTSAPYGTSTFQFQARADGGTFTGAGANFILTSPTGFAAIDEISAQQDAKEGAQITVSFWGLTDGTNPPFTLQSGQNLIGSVAANGLFKLASVTYEGTKVLGVQSVSVKLGIQFGTKRQSGALYADVGSIIERRPIVEVRGTNLTLLSDVGPSVEAISAGLVLYFQKVGASGANHVSITFSGGVYTIQGLNAQGTQDAEGSISADMAGGTIAFSTTATLP